MDCLTFEIPAFQTQGGTILDLKLAYRTYGELSPARDNVILVLTSYAAQHDDAEALFAASDVLDLSNHYVIVINMFCNGLSSSPSNTRPPYDGPRFPGITVNDNVTCQHRLVTEQLCIEKIRLVMGFSMGGLQTYEWGCRFPAMVEAILPICGAARVSPHNYLFLDGAKAALTADQSFANGDYDTQPEVGVLAFARVYAGWVFSQAFFREETYRELGMTCVEDAVEFMQDYFMRHDANDLLGMLWTWQHADISQNDRHNGDFTAALGAITARAIVMPGETDLYFTVADSEIEVSHMTNAELRPIPSTLGHVAGTGADPIGKAAIDIAIVDLLR
jgi:homoserine O-acetyltransferase/O-succinyltransferase